MNFFKQFIKEQIIINDYINLVDSNAHFAHTKLQALEDYLDIEFFHGDKSKPHYRKKRVIKRPVGRPRKK